MAKTAEVVKTKYLIDEKGRKTAVVINLKDYKNLLEFIEDLEDANDLLKAEKKAIRFTPYENFAKAGLSLELQTYYRTKGRKRGIKNFSAFQGQY